MADDRKAAGYEVEMRRWRTTGPVRIMVLLALAFAVGYVLAGTEGVLVAAIVGILYLLFVIARGGVLTVTYRRR